MNIENQKDAQPNIKTLQELSTDEILYKCGALRYSHTQVAALLRPRVTREELHRIVLALQTPDSMEYKLYESGMIEADFMLQDKLLEKASYSKDMYEAFNEEQRRLQINIALREKFGLGEEWKN